MRRSGWCLAAAHVLPVFGEPHLLHRPPETGQLPELLWVKLHLPHVLEGEQWLYESLEQTVLIDSETFSRKSMLSCLLSLSWLNSATAVSWLLHTVNSLCTSTDQAMCGGLNAAAVRLTVAASSFLVGISAV